MQCRQWREFLPSPRDSIFVCSNSNQASSLRKACCSQSLRQALSQRLVASGTDFTASHGSELLRFPLFFSKLAAHHAKKQDPVVPATISATTWQEEAFPVSTFPFSLESLCVMGETCFQRYCCFFCVLRVWSAGRSIALPAQKFATSIAVGAELIPANRI